MNFITMFLIRVYQNPSEETKLWRDR